jgi:hypothetical protein
MPSASSKLSGKVKDIFSLVICCTSISIRFRLVSSSECRVKVNVLLDRISSNSMSNCSSPPLLQIGSDLVLSCWCQVISDSVSDVGEILYNQETSSDSAFNIPHNSLGSFGKVFLVRDKAKRSLHALKVRYTDTGI